MLKSFSRVALLSVAAVAGLSAAPASAASVVQVSGAVGPSGHTYDVISDPTIDWAEAQAAANASGGHLVTITSAAEQAFVQKLLVDSNTPAGEYWIGLKKTGAATGSGYSWTTGESTAYQHWLPGQPDNNGGDETVGGILWSKAGDSTVDRRGFWNDLPNHFVSTDSTYEDLNNGGYVVEHGSTGAAVPLPAAAVVMPIGMFMAWRARRWVGGSKNA